MTATYLAFDLGAESGRAMLGRFHSGVLRMRELHRFPNQPVHDRNSLRWDALRLRHEVQSAFTRIADIRLDGIGVDTWGIDYALIGESGDLLENPYHYRDRRTDGIMNEVLALVGREEIYAATGIQFIPINTLYQLYAACRATPRLIEAAEALVTIPDLLNYWFTGRLCCEYTNATTTQFVNAATRGWATGLFRKLDLPERLLAPIIEPGTILGEFSGVPVIAPACHDTGSAVAAIASSGKTAFLSSGTWSLLGTEISSPVISPEALKLNFTNEGGVCGSVRLLKNITGLWLLQCCRRAWIAAGDDSSYDELFSAAELSPGFVTLLDPDHESFLRPDNMPAAIDDYSHRTGQRAPSDPPAYARAILESLAFKYRAVLDSLEQITATRFDEVRIIGGGSKNRLLNQFTADATGRRVIAGPVEATALGNIAMQMLATGAVKSLSDAREVIAHSFPTETFEPTDPDAWEKQYPRFKRLN